MIQRIKELLFTNRSTRQTIVKNTIWLTVGEIISRLLRAALIIYAARILGAEGYGIFSYMLSLAALFTIFSDFGISTLLTREMSKRENEGREEILSTFLVLKIGVLILPLLATIFLAPIFITLPGAQRLIIPIALLIASDSLTTFCFSLARAKNRMETEAIAKIVTNAVILAFGLLVLFVKPETKLLAFSYTFGSIVGLLVIFLILRKEFKNLLNNFRKDLVKPIFFSALPFAALGLLGGLMINIDTVILGWFRDASDLGLYAAAYRPILLLYTIPALFGASIFPIMNRLIHEKEYDRASLIIGKSTALLLMVGIPITIGGIILAPEFISLLFGVEYIGSSLSFQVLCLTLILIFPSTIINNAIFAHDRQKIFLFSSGFSAFLNVILDLLLIPSFGITGSAVATLFSQLFNNIYNWVRLKKIQSFSVFPRLPKVFISALVMTIAVLILAWLHIPVVITITAGAIVFLSLLLLLKEPLLGEILRIFR